MQERCMVVSVAGMKTVTLSVAISRAWLQNTVLITCACIFYLTRGNKDILLLKLQCQLLVLT